MSSSPDKKGGYNQAALDEASREVHMMLLREGSSWGTKACEEMGRVFMTTYLKALPPTAEEGEDSVGDWQCRDYADGWITFPDRVAAEKYQADTGAMMRYRRFYPALPSHVDAPAGMLPACPKCGSTNPKHHPATAPDGGEVHLCRHPWHTPTADEIEAEHAAQSSSIGTPLAEAIDHIRCEWARADANDEMPDFDGQDLTDVLAAAESASSATLPKGKVLVDEQLIRDIQSNAAIGEPEWSSIEDRLLRIGTSDGGAKP